MLFRSPAMWRAGELEALARMYHLALAAGRPVVLSDEEVARIMERLKTYGRGPEAEVAARLAAKGASPKKAGARKKIGAKTKSAAVKKAGPRRS